VTISTPDGSDRLNNRLAQLLALGTWVSCGLIAAGMVLQLSGASARGQAKHLVSIGIVLLIALPAVRVATSVIWLLFHRELDFALIAALVLVIMLASTLLGAGVG
jgi:hypothetical protein